METLLGRHGFVLGATLLVLLLCESIYRTHSGSQGASNTIGMRFGSLKHLHLLPLLCRNDLRCSTEFIHWVTSCSCNLFTTCHLFISSLESSLCHINGGEHHRQE